MFSSFANNSKVEKNVVYFFKFWSVLKIANIQLHAMDFIISMIA